LKPNQTVGRRRSAALLLVTVIGLGLLSGCGDTGTRSEFAPPPAFEQSRPLPSNSFAVLRQSPGQIPERLTQAIQDPPAQKKGWPVLQSLRHEAWAFEEEKQWCLLDQTDLGGPSAVCTSSEHAVQEGIVSTVLRDRAFEGRPIRSIVGFVPDRAKQVRVHTPGFPTVTRQVENNVFVLEDHISEPPEWIELVGRRSAATRGTSR
jgi:hypothetical protein